MENQKFRPYKQKQRFQKSFRSPLKGSPRLLPSRTGSQQLERSLPLKTRSWIRSSEYNSGAFALKVAEYRHWYSGDQHCKHRTENGCICRYTHFPMICIQMIPDKTARREPKIIVTGSENFIFQMSSFPYLYCYPSYILLSNHPIFQKKGTRKKYGYPPSLFPLGRILISCYTHFLADCRKFRVYIFSIFFNCFAIQ